MPFKSFTRLEIPDVMLVEYQVFPDRRGFFAELYKRGDFLANGIPYDFVQVNLSYSVPGVVRGLHYQLRPHEQGKLVTVIRGKIFDVAVDIRKGSPWYGRYVSVVLEPGYALWVPPGFAHGFQALKETHLVYLVTKEYNRESERCIRWNDEALGIEWPVREEDKVIISEKDKKCPSFVDAETNFYYP